MAQIDTIKDTTLRLFQEVHTWRCIIAAAAIASMMLPWTYLDGARGPLTGADLIAYTFTGSERLAMVGQSVPGSLALLVTPVLTLSLSILVFVRIYQGQHPLLLHAVTAFLPGLIILFAGSITSSDHLTGGGMASPQAGIILGFLCHATLAAYTLIERRQREKVRAEPPADAGTTIPLERDPDHPPTVVHRLENPDHPSSNGANPGIPTPPLRQPTPVSNRRRRAPTGPETAAAPQSQPSTPDDNMPVRVVTQPGHANWRPTSGSQRKHGRAHRQDPTRPRQGS